MNEAPSRNRFLRGQSAPGDAAAEGDGAIAGSGAKAIPLAAGPKEELVESAPPANPADDTVTERQSAAAGARDTVIQASRALAIADFDPPAASPGEKLLRLAYRLGVPGHALTSPFRKPPKPRLLATVESPHLGDRVAGMALRAGHFLVHGVKALIGQMDFSPAAKLTPPFDRVVHGFTWLRDMEACGARAQCVPTAQRITAAWLDANPNDGPTAYKGAAWNVGLAGQRLLGWLVHAPLLMSGEDRKLRNRLMAEMEITARWLDRHVTKADDRQAEVTAWCAIVAAGLLLPGGKPRRLFGEAGLARALGELVGDDGGVLSRSPQGQMDAIATLVELRACYRALRAEVPLAVETILQLLVPPLLALVHGDGGIGNWQGSGAVGPERLATLIAASEVRARPLRDVRQWGYQRVAVRAPAGNPAGGAVLLFDAAPPPLARHARFGCASTLAFEFSVGADRLIVNCGGAAFAGGLVPVRIEQGLRATAAHSTLVLGDANSTAVLINGKLGAGVGEVEVDRRTLDLDTTTATGVHGGGTATRLEASHDGYVSRLGLVHRRILIMRDDGSELRGEDLLVPKGRKGTRGRVPYALRFHLGPNVDVTLGQNGPNGVRGASLVLPDGSLWQFVTGDGTVELDESLWVDGEGRPHPVQQLVIQGLVSRGGGNFSWLFKKMG